jgi:hypothetical protein
MAKKGGGAVSKGFYVQVRYPHETVWVAVDVAGDRREASRLGGLAFRHLRDDQAQSPTQVRVVDDAKLRDEGGQEAINRAALDLWLRHGGRELESGHSS